MESIVMMRLLLLLIIVSVACSARAQNESLPSGEAILKSVDRNLESINDYAVNLSVSVDLDRLKVPKMLARMYFKRPDKVHFESEGFALLPKEGLTMIGGGLTQRFSVESVKKEGGRYILIVRPNDDKSKLRRVMLKVDAGQWTVASVVMPQTDGRQMKADFTYTNVGEYFLPSSLTVSFTSDTASQELPDPFANLPTLQRRSQAPRTGTIKVIYSDYQVNTGLKDELFDKSGNLEK